VKEKGRTEALEQGRREARRQDHAVDHPRSERLLRRLRLPPLLVCPTRKRLLTRRRALRTPQRPSPLEDVQPRLVRHPFLPRQNRLSPPQRRRTVLCGLTLLRSGAGQLGGSDGERETRSGVVSRSRDGGGSPPLRLHRRRMLTVVVETVVFVDPLSVRSNERTFPLEVGAVPPSSSSHRYS
jgi:hypothetical protein